MSDNQRRRSLGTEGSYSAEGVEVSFGGMTPVQGFGTVDGFPCYYRARGEGWQFEVYAVGVRLDTDENLPADPIFETGGYPYEWPDGGYASPKDSPSGRCGRRSCLWKWIEQGVAEFRAAKAAKTTALCADCFSEAFPVGWRTPTIRPTPAAHTPVAQGPRAPKAESPPDHPVRGGHLS